MCRVGVIGMGVMGKPMAENLLRAGFPVTVFNRNRERCAGLAERGAAIARSPREVARASHVVITVVSDTAAMEETLFCERGVAAGLEPRSVVIDMSTISPAATIEFARRIGEIGCQMLDAPVSGGQKGAIAGTLGIMVGGRQETFEQCLPILRAMGKTITYTGRSGNGQKTKLVNQLVGAVNLLAAVEGVRLLRVAGLDPESTLKAVGSGAASSWMVVNLAPLIVQGNYEPGFSIRLQLKDLKLVQEWISELGGDFPAAGLVHELFRRAVEIGLQEQGTQGLINLWPASDSQTA